MPYDSPRRVGGDLGPQPSTPSVPTTPTQLTDPVFPSPMTGVGTESNSGFPPGYGQRPEVRAARKAAREARKAAQAQRGSLQSTVARPSGEISAFAPSPLIQRDAASREPTSFFPMRRG